MKNQKIMFILFSLLSQIAWTQISKSKSDSLQKAIVFDYFAKEYTYVTKDLKIVISSKQFDSLFAKYKFYPRQRFSKSDSLQIVLKADFKNSHFVRNAAHQFGYSWNRVSLYSRLPEAKLQMIAATNNIKFPYNFKKKLEEEKQDKPELEKITSRLRELLSKQFGIDTIQKMSNKQLLAFSFKNNPEVKKLREVAFDKKRIERFVAKHKRQPTHDELSNLGVECGKENCCQKK